jgi:hypothetical protein
MTNETEDIQRLKPKPAEGFIEKNTKPDKASSITDYLQLYAAAQWLRFPKKIESENFYSPGAYG